MCVCVSCIAAGKARTADNRKLTDDGTQISADSYKYAASHGNYFQKLMFSSDGQTMIHFSFLKRESTWMKEPSLSHWRLTDGRENSSIVSQIVHLYNIANIACHVVRERHRQRHHQLVFEAHHWIPRRQTCKQQHACSEYYTACVNTHTYI